MIYPPSSECTAGIINQGEWRLYIATDPCAKYCWQVTNNKQHVMNNEYEIIAS